MMNEDYKIFGKIIAGLNKDHPPKVSHGFSDKVMSRINTSYTSNVRSVSSNYLNIAASVVIAVVTSMVLVSYNSDTKDLASNDTSKPEKINDGLIKKVIDKDSCSDSDYTSSRQDHACK